MHWNFFNLKMLTLLQVGKVKAKNIYMYTPICCWFFVAGVDIISFGKL